MNDRGIQIANEAYRFSSSPVSFDVRATDGVIHNFPWGHYVESALAHDKLVIWTSARIITLEGVHLEEVREAIRTQCLSSVGSAVTTTMDPDHRCFIHKITLKPV